MITYMAANPGVKYAVNVPASNASFRSDFESGDYLETLAEMGVKIYAYTFNKVNISDVPQWADGAVSEDCNVNFERYVANI